MSTYLFTLFDCPNRDHPNVGVCGLCGYENMHEGDCCESCLQDFDYDPGYRVDDECCCRAFKDGGTREVEPIRGSASND